MVQQVRSNVLQIKNATVMTQLHLLNGGAGRSRTDLHGFAIRCITALLPRHLSELSWKFKGLRKNAASVILVLSNARPTKGEYVKYQEAW